MRSVPEIVAAKLVRVSLRIFSTPSSSATLTPSAAAVSMALPRRLSTLSQAMRKRVMIEAG